MLLGGITVISVLIAGGICGCAGAFSGWDWLLWLPAGFLVSFLALGIGAFLFLWVMCLPVDFSVPQKKDSPFYRGALKLYAPAILQILQARVHTRGLEMTPKSGRFLLVCNHINDLDPVTLLAYFQKSQLAFITKRENMSMFLVGKLMHKTLCQPINRENDREALRTILNCVRLLQEDQVSIAVFPEGYTSLDGRLQNFRHGVFKIAQKTNVPIAICTLQNTNKVFHNIMRLKSTDVHLHLLKVMQPEEYAGMTAVQIGEYVHGLMAQDLGPELVAQPKENT